MTVDTTVYARWESKPLSYVVHYYLNGTTESVADDRVVDARAYSIGDTVTEKAMALPNYKQMTNEESLVLSANEEENVIIFYYVEKPHDIEYTVYYLIEGTDIPVAAPVTKTVDGSTITVKAIPAAVDKAYMAAHGATEEQLSKDWHPVAEVVEHTIVAGENIINIYYADYHTAPVTINYLDMDGNPIKAAETVNAKLNSTVNFNVTAVNGYSFKRSEIDGVSGTKKSLKVTEGRPYTVNVYFQKTLRIEGKTITHEYDGTAYKLATVDDVNVTGLASGHTLSSIAFTNAAGRKNIGTTMMKPKTAVISGASDDYYKITYVSGSVTITPVEVTVIIAGDQVEETYDGQAHTAGYKIVSISNPLYKSSYIVFNGTEKTVSRTDVGRSDLVLQGLFTNKTITASKNFNVTFVVSDGSVNIKPATLH